MGLKVVRLSDEQVLGGPMGIIRGLAHVIDGLAYVGYLFPLWTRCDKHWRTRSWAPWF
jgi:hypothetical protein